MKKLVIQYDDQELLNDIMANYPEFGRYQMICTKFNYGSCLYTFIDETTEKEYNLDRPKLTRALNILIQKIAKKELPGLGLNLANFTDAGEWDDYASDALIQQACLGDVLYG